MFKNYFKTAFRNIRKNKLYSIINIFGLTVGLCACLLIGVYINHEMSYDKFNVNADRIVRVTMDYGSGGTDNNIANTGSKVGPEFKRRFPLVQDEARTFINHNVIKSGDKVFDEPRVLYADSTFFKMFSFHFIEGNQATALDATDKIAISKSMAKKYFGSNDAMNKIITCGGKDLRVSGVFADVPQNSQLKFDFATSFLNIGNSVKTETWWTANWITYLLVQDTKNISQLQQQINDFTSTASFKTDAGLKGQDYLRYNLEPLTRVHLYSALPGFEPNGSITYIYMFAIIAFLILIIACANYTNLATAQASGRTGEIGMRKVMGASKQMVFSQFMGESFILTFIAALIAFILSILLLPYFNEITGMHFTSKVLMQPLPVISLLLFTITVSFFAGLYPALMLSGTSIIGVLKSGFRFTGGNNLLRKSLIVTQFGISVFLIIYTVIILQQMNFMKTKNLGYDKDHLLVLPIGGKMLDQFKLLKDAFSQIKGVESITASYDTPEYVGWGDGITVVDEKGKHDISVTAMPVALDFIKTTKMRLDAGRDFNESDFSMMDTSNGGVNYKQPYIINETLAKKIGWSPQQAIGRQVEKGQSGSVVGVVKDFNFSSLKEPIGPMLIFLDPGFSRNFLLRINGNDMQATLGRLETVWKQRIPDRPFNYHFLEDDYNKLYLSEQQTSVLFTMAASLAIILACLGLFGLAAFTTVQRTKEIGIRRVLGANIGNITILIAKNFLLLVGVAILIASPLAWWMSKNWLQDYAFRIPVNMYVFVVTAMVTVLIALITVSFHSVKAALMSPVKSLRAE